jgi:hypothetical protein
MIVIGLERLAMENAKSVMAQVSPHYLVLLEPLINVRRAKAQELAQVAMEKEELMIKQDIS